MTERKPHPTHRYVTDSADADCMHCAMPRYWYDTGFECKKAPQTPDGLVAKALRTADGWDLCKPKAPQAPVKGH